MGGEWLFAEKPAIGYAYLHPDLHDQNRDAQNHVLFKPAFRGRLGFCVRG